MIVRGMIVTDQRLGSANTPTVSQGSVRGSSDFRDDSTNKTLQSAGQWSVRTVPERRVDDTRERASRFRWYAAVPHSRLAQSRVHGTGAGVLTC